MFSSVSRYDAVLAAIALSMLLAGVVGVVSRLAMTTALALGSLPASGGVGYALFGAAPEE